MLKRRAACVLACVLTSGCSGMVAHVVQMRHAGEFNCPEDEVKVSKLAGTFNAYRADGCGLSAIYVCGDSGCVRNSDATGSQVAEVSAPEGPGQPLSVTLATDGPELKLLAEIVESWASTYLEFRTPRVTKPGERSIKRDSQGHVVFDEDGEVTYEMIEEAVSPPKWQGCTDVRAVVDGDPVTLGEVAYTLDTKEERLRVPVSPESLEKIRTGSRTVGAICGTRWTLQAGARASIDGLVLKVKEELALRKPAQPSGSGGESEPAASPTAPASADSTKL